MEMTAGMKFVVLLAELMTLFSAVLVALHPNILYASIALLFTFMGVAVMFLAAGADFLAGAQVVVYVGGVTILVLFAIMLTQWLYEVKLRDLRDKALAPIVLAGLFLYLILGGGLRELGRWILTVPPEKMAEFSMTPKTQAIGTALMGNYVLPFEVVTILLLGALVGAVWLARPR